jgi:hypothetical protein
MEVCAEVHREEGDGECDEHLRDEVGRLGEGVGRAVSDDWDTKRAPVR